MGFKVNASTLYQWDTDRTVEITPKNGFAVDEVHFKNPESDAAFVMKPTEVNGTLQVRIPDVLLQTTRGIVVYAVMYSQNGAWTIESCSFGVASRQKPANYVYTEESMISWKWLDDRITKLEQGGGGGGGLTITDDGNGNVTIV